ncbi:hypothetical protein THAOC_26178 [Thalassiosira oceanica]|uniref:Uncharacterized protein n=1 Tax=Thalassiosira oceanica TaxID=159749 RepID=K0S5U5_THAOC|nr:hypothetical protein THAOC_26178 [Thalassiosira oceanica]|eukprot:EJK54222.1 hypothetical protein THAOC_26178 [Thalassiosira oceanica]
MVTPPAYRLQSPRSDLSGYARRRATATRPRPDGQFRHEDQLISSFKSLGSYFGNYWTGEEVADSDLHPFAPSALLQDGLGLCCGDQVAVMSCDGHWQAAFVGIVGDPYRRAFFFLTALLAVTSYHTNKTRLAEAPFGPVGDDNGPGSEPPPHDRLRYV